MMRFPHPIPDGRQASSPIAVEHAAPGSLAGPAGALDDGAPVYVWPLNPWGGCPFPHARS